MKTIIAHRGASGCLPEHTLPATAMAYAMGAHYLEADLVLTQDSIPIVLHDIFLESTTNVAALFPTLRRADGHWYAIDFTLAQIKQLSAHERIDATGKPIFPHRFPLGKSHFEVPTFAEWIELIQGLNQSTGRTVGIYPELKCPAFHVKAGYAFAEIVLSLLQTYGYTKKQDPIFVQCFDGDYLRYCRKTLKSALPFIQLIEPPTWPGTKTELKIIATYAEGIGVEMQQIVEPTWVQTAHQCGLLVHVYTLRADFKALLDLFLNKFDVDGVFTDFPDQAIQFLAK